MQLSEALRYFMGPFPKVRAAMKGYHPESDMSHHPFPTMVQVQTINACNASCVMCPYGRTPDSQMGGQMEHSLWDKIVNEIAEHEYVDTFIPMLQDEPFLDPKILEKVSAFKEKTRGRVKIELVTHGGLLTPETIAMICRTPLDTLTISVDSIHKEVYEKIRVGLSYDIVMSNIQKLIEARPKTRLAVRMVRQTLNRNEVQEFVVFWRARGVEAMAWDIGNRSGAVQQYDALQVSHENARWYSMVGNILLERFTPHCPVPFYSASILHNGDLLACGFDWLHESVVGNVRNQTIAEIWNSDKMRKIRKLHYEKRAQEIGMCGRCSIWQKTWAPKGAPQNLEAIK
jgi:radical SAM protein with 4Fe4S-binding SPASM domain